MGGLGVQRGGRLVGQQHRRLGGQRAGDADALLLAAGELRRDRQSARSASPTRSSSSSARLRRSVRPTPAISSGSATFSAAVREVSRLNCWKIMPTLRRVARSCAPRIRRDVLAGDADRARGRLLEPVHAADQRALAGAAAPDDAEDLALGDVEIDAVEGDDAVREDLAQAADLDRC